jgi:hypothetical protein
VRTCSIEGCGKKYVGLGYCSKHYTRLKRYGDPLYPGKQGGGFKARKIDFKLDNGCFIITSHKLNADGYAETMIRGVTKKVHRHVYEQCFGKIPDGLVVRHKCDNPSCVNPDHLETGTHKDNVKDMISRNRQAKGSRKHFSKLTESDVLEIRTSLARGLTNREIANKFSIDESIISEIKNRKAWKHVKEEV